MTVRGKVLQAVPGETSKYTVLIYVTKGRFGIWDDIVWLYYNGSTRLIPDDIVEAVGRATEPVTYETSGLGTLTVPGVDVIKARLVK